MNVGVAYINQLNAGMQQAQSLPPLAFSAQSWPQPSPFHNRGFPDQQNFVGRTALLQDTKTALDAGRDVALTQPVAMHGAGGIGKTRAAVEFVRAHGSSYTLRLFLDAQSPDSLRASLADTATKLRLTDDPKASTEDLVLLALRLLRAVPSALVVADNADTPEALEAVRTLCHQPGGVRWLITTRLTDLGDEFAPQRVDVLSEAEAIKLLQQRARKKHHNPGGDVVARAVAIELGCLPLALQQAAAYVARHRLAWPQYSTLLATNPAEALSHDAVEMKDLPESILRTYSISIAQLTPLAREMLEAACQLAPAAIPETVFLNEDVHHKRRSALVELADLSLIDWQSGLLEVHRAISIAVCHGLGQSRDQRVRLEQACRYVTNSCVSKDPQHPDHWPTWGGMRPHIEHLLVSVNPDNAATDDYLFLCSSWPVYLSAIGECAAAVGYYSAAFGWFQRFLGAEHSETLVARNNLATALQSQGMHVEAEQEHKAVLEIRKRVLGAEHPDTLGSRNNLAVALAAQDKHVEAEQEHRTVLQISERVLGAEHPDTLSSRNNLANAFKAQGLHAKAEQEHRVVVHIRARVLGAEHPKTLTSRSNLALAMQGQGRHAEAEQECRAVLEIQDRLLGEDHPDTLTSRSTLANALYAQRKNDAAELEYRKVLALRNRVLSAEHPEVARSYYNLALCLLRQLNYPEAFQLIQLAEQIRQKVLGPDAPDTQAATALRQHIEAELKKGPPPSQ